MSCWYAGRKDDLRVSVVARFGPLAGISERDRRATASRRPVKGVVAEPPEEGSGSARRTQRRGKRMGRRRFVASAVTGLLAWVAAVEPRTPRRTFTVVPEPAPFTNRTSWSISTSQLSA